MLHLWWIRETRKDDRVYHDVLVGYAGTKRAAEVAPDGGWTLLDVPAAIRVLYDEKWTWPPPSDDPDFVRYFGDNDTDAANYPNESIPHTVDDIASAEREYDKLRAWKKRNRTVMCKACAGTGRRATRECVTCEGTGQRRNLPRQIEMDPQRKK